MPIISACRSLFPDADSPWTLTEISARLLCIESGMNYDRVQRAWAALAGSDDDELVAKVQPSNGAKRPMRFKPVAARLIARQALSRDTKKRLIEMARTGTAKASGAPAPKLQKKQK